MIRKQVHLMMCILFSITILTACTAPTPEPTNTPMPTATPEPTATNTSAPIETSIPTATARVVQPSKLGYHAAAYDSRADRVIVVWGLPSINSLPVETWAYDIATNSWTNRSPAQSLDVVEGPISYDSVADRTILFSGNIPAPSKTGSVDSASRTWAYDYSSNTWTDLKTTGGPSGLLGARMVYDTQADRMILFGGLNVPIIDTYNTDTWVYEFNTNTWTNMHPTTSPPGQNFFQMVYDAASDRVLAWIIPDVGGGNNMWAYDLENNTWTAQPVKEPAFRPYAGIVYVPTMQRDFVFGGVTEPSESPLDDMWTYDSVSNTWEQVPFTSGPSARGWATLTYSDKADRLVLIGGGVDRGSFTNEVWIFDPKAKTWTQIEQK